MAKLRGAKVIGVVSSGEKADIAREAGAAEVIVFADHDFEQEARWLTGWQGVNVVYDSGPPRDCSSAA
jgi:NADPH:quinone reductase